VTDTLPTAALPKITIVTPSFNQGHYLEETFKSVLAQNYPNLEWFVVDGGSKDNSVDLIKRYEQHFAWWVSEKDRNHPHALNKGYAKATGDVFCFVNSDDTLDPGTLHYVAKRFADPKVDWVVGWARYFLDDGTEWPYTVKPTERPVDWLVSNPVPQIASFWRTSVRDKIGDFSEEYLWSFDYEYWLRMYFKGGYRPAVVQKCMGGFRLQPNSKTVSKPQNYLPDNEKLTALYGPMMPADQQGKLKREAAKKKNRLLRDKAWMALKSGDRREARRHALQAVRQRVGSIEAWKAAYYTFRGY
jgi:glycosyltransferase involved in cell wall biosynthesis